MPKKKVSTPSNLKPEFGAKAAFVRSKPGISAPDVVTMAKTEGLEVTAAYVHNIRANDNKSAESATNGRVSTISPMNRDGESLDRYDAEFRAVAVKIGLPRAKALLEKLMIQVDELISGPKAVIIGPRRRGRPVGSKNSAKPSAPSNSSGGS
jgi:hypothetical protein